jgi:hypothetical protein
LRASLIQFYSDLFEFFQAVSRVFSTKTGSELSSSFSCPQFVNTSVLELKRTPTVIGDLLWKPFNARFSDILDRMSFHQNIVRQEISIEYMSSIKHLAENSAKLADEEVAERQLMASVMNDTNSLLEKGQKRM